MSTVEDHVVIMTGAGGGLGGAMVRGLLAAGRRVVGVDLELASERLAVLATDAAASDAAERLVTVTGNVGAPDDCARIVARACERFGTVHALVNCAGVGPDQWREPGGGFRVPKFYELGVDRWLDTIDSNLNGPYLMAHAVTPQLIAQGWGRIVNIVTGYTTMVKYSPYGPAKAGLEAATVCWASDLDGTGVTVNALLPGAAANTAMVPEGLVADRSRLVQPVVMVRPVVALTSRISDGVTARRIVAMEWDDGTLESNLAKAEPAAWGTPWTTSRSPALR